MIGPLSDLIGREQALDALSRTLRDVARSYRAAGVGAVHVSCSDESERENVEAFQQWFVEDLLPELKFAARSPFRTANLGARYEWGAIPIAEHHFTTPAAREGFKVLVVKIDAHVAAHEEGGRTCFGAMDRYAVQSTFCGAIHAALDGASLPAAGELREALASQGRDRTAALNDPQIVEPALRGLYAAVASARLQARRAAADLRDHQPHCPTLYLVAAGVTINRPQRDTELLVGLYVADHRGTAPDIRYVGLSDDPATYRIRSLHGPVELADAQMHEERPARDPRDLIRAAWRRRGSVPALSPPDLRRLAPLAAEAQGGRGAAAREALAAIFELLAAARPTALAVELFLCRGVEVWHMDRADRLAHDRGDVQDAQAILGDFRGRIGRLAPEEIAALARTLTEEHLGAAAPPAT